MKKLFLTAALLTLTAAAFAQNAKNLGPQAQGDENSAQKLTNTQCQSTFISGSGSTYMNFCTSANGNISRIQTPSGWDQLYFGAEGYGICDETNLYGYYDWGQYGDSGNWMAATITQPNGPSTFPLTITRTTSDGVFTLKQVFSQNKTTPGIKVTMTLTNNSDIVRETFLTRFADIDADTFSGGGGNTFDSTEFSAWGVVPGGGAHGLIARGSSSKWWRQARVVSGFQDPCKPTLLSTPFNGDGASLLIWQPGFGPHQSLTMSMEYRPF